MDKITFRCEGCGKRLSAPVNRAGALAKCPSCGGQVRIPDAAKALAGSEAVPQAQEAAGAPVAETHLPPPAAAGTSGLAITSLVLGILSVGCLGILAGLPAIMCGHIAHGRIRRSGGQLKGAVAAIVGFILGYVSIVWTLVLIAVLARALGPARQMAQRAHDLNNLHQIGLAIAMYENTNADRLPPSLDALVAAGYCDTAVFVNQRDSQPETTEGAMPTSYRYIGGLRGGYVVDGMTIIAYTRRGVFEDGRNLLFADMHVEWVNESQIGARFADSYELLKSSVALTPDEDRAARAFYEMRD